MQEKRQNTRVEKALIIQYAQSTPVPLRWDSTTIKNISTDGVFFNSHKLFAKKEILCFRFTVPTDPFNRLEVAGEVVESFINGHGTRIKFINLDEQQKKVICDYVEFLLKKNKKSSD
jgi:hypothetical protein